MFKAWYSYGCLSKASRQRGKNHNLKAIDAHIMYKGTEVIKLMKENRENRHKDLQVWYSGNQEYLLKCNSD